MNIKEQAIKIERLKNERDAHITSQNKLIIYQDLLPRVRGINSEITTLDKEREEINKKVDELRDRIKTHGQHYDLLIKATVLYHLTVN